MPVSADRSLTWVLKAKTFGATVLHANHLDLSANTKESAKKTVCLLYNMRLGDTLGKTS